MSCVQKNHEKLVITMCYLSSLFPFPCGISQEKFHVFISLKKEMMRETDEFSDGLKASRLSNLCEAGYG